MSGGTQLVRALEASARAAGCAVRVAAASERPWASATFVGARHSVVLEANASPALGQWLTALPDADVAVQGHVVAEVAVNRAPGGARVDALLLVAA